MTSPQANTPGTLVRGRRLFDEQVAGRVGRQLAGEDLGVGLMADGHEEPLGVELRFGAGDTIAQTEGAHAFVTAAEDLGHFGVQDPGDLRIGLGALQHDLRGPELPPPVHDGDLGGETREVDRFLEGGIAAADDRDLLALKKKPSQVAQAETP